MNKNSNIIWILVAIVAIILLTKKPNDQWDDESDEDKKDAKDKDGNKLDVNQVLKDGEKSDYAKLCQMRMYEIRKTLYSFAKDNGYFVKHKDWIVSMRTALNGMVEHGNLDGVNGSYTQKASESILGNQEVTLKKLRDYHKAFKNKLSKRELSIINKWW